MKNVSTMQFSNITDGRGALTAIEGGDTIPFDICRVYYITSAGEGVRRGLHAHRVLKQVLICLNGSIRILTKTPYEEQTHLLCSPDQGLYIGPMVWREMYDFSENAVLLVLASEHYDENDYFREYSSYEAEAITYFKQRINT